MKNKCFLVVEKVKKKERQFGTKPTNERWMIDSDQYFKHIQKTKKGSILWVRPGVVVTSGAEGEKKERNVKGKKKRKLTDIQRGAGKQSNGAKDGGQREVTKSVTLNGAQLNVTESKLIQYSQAASALKVTEELSRPRSAGAYIFIQYINYFY